MQHMLPQQIKRGSAEHLPFDQLQAIDLSLYLTITVRRRESGMHCRVIAADTLRKTFQFGNATPFGLDQPCIQVLVSTIRLRRNKGLTELVGGLELTMSLADLFDLVALLVIQLCRLAHTQPRGLCWGHLARQWRRC